jgi:hypothetical protein
MADASATTTTGSDSSGLAFVAYDVRDASAELHPFTAANAREDLLGWRPGDLSLEHAMDVLGQRLASGPSSPYQLPV